MSEILKTEAVVLSKMNYGDTSIISKLFTKANGIVSVIIKGGRSPKSKYGSIVDPINHLSVIYYKKDTRELQILSDAEIISHFPAIKEDLSKLKYTYAIIELLKNLIAENEVNDKLFSGTIRIFERINSSYEKPEISFGRYFMFFLKQIGYELQIDKCAVCGTKDFTGNNLVYSYEKGLICSKCRNQAVEFYEINLELITYLNCLKNNAKADFYQEKIIFQANKLLENHLKYHVSDFKGIQSFQILSERED
jgi:DNA repair protein RecO (recombination protein O)